MLSDKRIRELARLAVATWTPQDLVLADDGALYSPQMEKLFRIAIREEREAAAKCVPSNWCDPLLTGPNGIGQPPYNCNHVERLLREIAAAIRARAGAQGGSDA